MIYFITLYLLYLLADKLLTINKKDSEISKMVKNMCKLCFIMLMILNLYGFCISNIIYSCVCIYIISYIRNDEIKTFLDMFNIKQQENFVQDITQDGSFSRIPGRYRRPDPNIQKYKLNNNQNPEFISKSTFIPKNNVYDDEELKLIKNSLEEKEWLLKENETYNMFTKQPEVVNEQIKQVYKGICYYIDGFFSKFGL